MKDAQVPVVTRKGGLNPDAVKQISSGSIVGEFGLLILWVLCVDCVSRRGGVGYGEEMRGCRRGWRWGGRKV